jgi:uncharacterized membrane protein
MTMKKSRRTEAPPSKYEYALDAHHRIFISCIVAALAFFGLAHHVRFTSQLVLTWDAFTVTALALAWFVIVTKDPYEARRNARLQDSSATFLFTVVILAAVASLLAVGIVLHSAKDLPAAEVAGHVALSATAVILSWAFVHTAFALRYAHRYYFDARDVERHAVSGGLIFPGKESPSFMDFAYFSFVVGMTCQVSDVQISAPTMRRLALIHGLISFAFNTAILAMFVNIIAGLV